MKKNKIIGILAGMGPKSTAPFVDLVINECQKQYGAKYDEDFPHIIIYSLPTPFYVDKPIDHKKLEATVIVGLQKLASTGVDFVAIPCNTVHAYFNNLKRSIDIPLLNIVEETLKKVKGKKQKIAVLATKATIDSNVYQDGIALAGHGYVGTPEWQNLINEIILTIKSGKKINDAKNKLQNLLKDLKKNKISTTIVACTDLNVILEKNANIQLIDSSKCLAEAVIREFLAK